MIFSLKKPITYKYRSLLIPIILFFMNQGHAQNSIGSALPAEAKAEAGVPQNPQFIKGSPSTSLRGAGMMFTQNKGQIVDVQQNLRPDILYKGNGGGVDVYLRKTGISYVLSNMAEVNHTVNQQLEELMETGLFSKQDAQNKRLKLLEKQIVKLNRVDVDFVNANSAIEIQAAGQVDGYTNYYYPHCPNGITHVNSWNEVTVKNIYNNIDVKYYGGKENGLKYDIVVNPGGNPEDIQIKYSGTDGVEINPSAGRLRIKNSVNEIMEKLPKVYQNINGKIIDVKTEYRLEHLTNNDVIVHFSFSTFNSSFTLVVDPWASYYSSSQSDYSNAVATDANANVVFTGFTDSPSLPVSAGAFQTLSFAAVAKSDTYVVKMDVNGVRIFATYIGGSTGWEFGEGIATDASGNIYSTGFTESTDFPVGFSGTNVVFQNTHSAIGAKDAFLFKFDPNGLRLWGTYYGGTGDDVGGDISIDGTDVYLGGTTSSTNVISTAGCFQPAFGGGTYDGFVAKFTSTGSRIWGTYIGGTDREDLTTVSCTPAGDICCGGGTSSTDFPVSIACHQAVKGGGSDAFVFKLNSAGARLWATYYGGTADDGGGITTDGLGNVILSGSTFSLTGIASAGAYQTVFGGGSYDGFAAKFNTSGVRQWGTYLGGNRNDFIQACSTDGKNNIYAFGEAEDMDMGTFPITPCAYQPVFAGVEDNFITKLDPDGKLVCSTYIGGTKEDDLDQGGGIAVYANSYIYITGYTNGGYPVTAGAFQTVSSALGDYDAFITQLCINICEAKVLYLDFSANVNSVCSNVPVTFTPVVANTCDTTGYKYKWFFPGGNPSSSTAINPVVTYPAAGTYSARYVLTTVCKKDSVVKNNFITVSPCNPTAATINICKNTCDNITATDPAGPGPYSYLWSPGGGTAKTINVCPSANTIYTVTITDALSVTSTKTIVVSLYPQVNATTGATNILCGGTNTGSAVVNPGGGAAPYSYFWSNSQTTQTATGLKAGNYTVTVTDQNSCTASQTVNLTQPPPLVVSAASTNVDCMTSGSASVFISSGVSPYSWRWSNGLTGSTTSLQTFGSTSIISGLTAGSYSVTVTDGNGCTQAIPFIITGAAPGVSASFTQSVTAICKNVQVNFTHTGTAGTYSWLISPITPANVSGTTTDFSYTFLTAGNYSITHTVTSGTCKSTITNYITVNNCTGPAVSATGSSVCQGSCANVTSSGSGGTSPYTYSWSTGATTQNINPCPVSTTTYTVTINDTGGNTSTSTAVVTINPVVTATTTATNITCNGASTGSATATGSNGTPGYVYNWSNGVSGSMVSGLPAGNYTVTVTDSKGCTTTSTAGIISPPPLAGQFTKGTVSCAACGCKEWIMVNAAGGTSPYSYNWQSGYDKRYLNNLCPGAYTINIKDKNGCSINVNLTAP